MTREQLIECMAKAECLHDDPKCNWEALPERHKDSYRESQAAVLDAITAAGMVVAPKKNIAEWTECLDAMARGAGGWAWEDVLDEMRAMTEAANG